MKIPEIKFYPEAVPEKWDNIEIEAIYEDEDGNCEPVHNNSTEIHFYSVYLHDVEGGVSCIADCTTEAEAMVLRDLLKKTTTCFKDNGFLK